VAGARAIAAAVLLLLQCALWQPARAETLRIGYQRYGTLILLKERGSLEQRLAPLGWTVQWKLFVAGPQLLEALNAGALDFGITGETPPIFAQAAGAPIAYVGVEPSAPQGEAILVPSGSRLQSVAELTGKRVALNKGSNVHYLLVRALEAAGLHWSDIRPVSLSPADAPAAFQAGDVDAWVIWDPYMSAAETNLGARVLRDGAGLAPNR
jgi:sulfonate transport system substrate-binding protein